MIIVTDDADFVGHVVESLAGLPGVLAVSLGGSRAQGTHRPDSDWDFALYYRENFEPEHVRALGWEGRVSEVNEWSPGVFNGGAWVRIMDRAVDIHYRDLDVVEHQIAEAEAGRFEVEPLMFHLAGIPTYLVVGELAINEVLHGSLPTPDYPPALRETAPGVWWAVADLGLTYARANHAPYGRLTECAGAIAQAACQTAHAVLASRGEWVTNEKSLLARAEIRGSDEIVSTLAPAELTSGIDEARALLAEAAGMGG